MTTIEKFNDVEEVECNNAQGPGRDFDCKIETPNETQRDEYYVDEFDFWDFHRTKSKNGKIVGVGRHHDNIECRLQDTNGLIHLQCFKKVDSLNPSP